MVRTAFAFFVLATTAAAAQSAAPQAQNPTQPAAQQQPGSAAWAADQGQASPAPPGFVPGLGTASNGDVLGSAPKVVRVSGGTMEAQLVRRVQPVYPAQAQPVPGTIVVAAHVGKNGRVKSAWVISGPPALQKPALDAVKQWVFKPYLLNGEPVPVETTIALSASRSER